MKSEFIKKVIILTFSCPALFACTQPPGSGNLKISIPVDDGSNHYALQTRELHTVTDIYAMAGSAAAFKADGHFDIDEDDSGHGFIEDGYEEGTTPSAHFLKTDDGVYHAVDSISLSMASAMYHFENIKSFYDEFSATDGMVFPRPILYNMAVTAHKDNQSIESVNNAAYVPDFDFFWINPYNDVNIPLTFNGGVLAHEYLHNVFMTIIKAAAARHLNGAAITPQTYQEAEKLVKSGLELNEWLTKPQAAVLEKNVISFAAAPPPLRQNAPPAPANNLSASDLKIANTFLFNSVNEGIADYFGYEYSNNPAWIMASLPSQNFRVLSDSKQFLASVDVQEKRFIESSKTTDPKRMLDVHGIGAYFAHFLWTVANDPSWGHAAAKRAALDFMKNYADFLITSKDQKYLSMGNLVQMFFKTRVPGPTLCQQIQTQFFSELNTYNCGLYNPSGGQPTPVVGPQPASGPVPVPVNATPPVLGVTR